MQSKFIAKHNDNFRSAGMKFISAKGRVIITGIGKSAIIANKNL